MAEQGSMGLQGEGGWDVSFTVGSGRVSLRRFYLNKDQWGWKSELWRGPGEACSSKRRQHTPKALTGSTECMRTGKETATFHYIVLLDPCLFWAVERQSPVFMSWPETGMAQTLLQIPSLYVVAVPTLLFLCITCEIQKSALQALAVQVPYYRKTNFYPIWPSARDMTSANGGNELYFTPSGLESRGWVPAHTNVKFLSIKMFH